MILQCTIIQNTPQLYAIVIVYCTCTILRFTSDIQVHKSDIRMTY